MCKPEAAKVAVTVGLDAQGKERVIASAAGEKAQQAIEEAQASGVPVREDPQLVGDLLRRQGGGAAIAPEIYELMASIIDFTQELSDLRMGRLPEDGDPHFEEDS